MNGFYERRVIDGTYLIICSVFRASTFSCFELMQIIISVICYTILLASTNPAIILIIIVRVRVKG